MILAWFGEIGEGIGSSRSHFWWHRQTAFPFSLEKRMNSAWNDDVLGCGVIFNLPLEIMKSCNQAFIFENLFFFNFAPEFLRHLQNSH